MSWWKILVRVTRPYLNGKKNQQATPIQLGDKLLVGKSILRLSLYEPTAEIELIAHPPAGALR